MPTTDSVIRTRRRWETDNSQLRVVLQKHMGFLGATGLNNMWIEWRNKFTAALDEVAPNVSTTVRSRRTRCPWMTPCLLNLIHNQKSLHRKIIRSTKQNQEAMKRHRQIPSLTSNMYRNLKNEHFQQRISEYRKLPKLFRSTINYITGRKARRLPPSIEMTQLTAHFQNLLTCPGMGTLECSCLPSAERSLCEFNAVSRCEVENLLKDLNPSKATGPDDISSTDLKLALWQNLWVGVGRFERRSSSARA